MTTTGTTAPPGQPRWLYQAQDAQGRPTEGSVHAQTAEEAMQAIAALLPQHLRKRLEASL